jgi:hypothetical protein
VPNNRKLAQRHSRKSCCHCCLKDPKQNCRRRRQKTRQLTSSEDWDSRKRRNQKVQTFDHHDKAAANRNFCLQEGKKQVPQRSCSQSASLKRPQGNHRRHLD